MKAELLCTIEKFPALQERITTLFNDNEEFRVLCYDYFLCVKSLGQWEMSLDKDQQFHHGFKEQKAILESELIRFVDHSRART
jgi:hypothetical protein